MDEPQYDLFVSYSHGDQAWVRKKFLPSLEQAGLQSAIDYREFSAGVPSQTDDKRVTHDVLAALQGRPPSKRRGRPSLCTNPPP